MNYQALKEAIKEIDPRYKVEPHVVTDDSDKDHLGIKITIPHHIHGSLHHVARLSEGELILFWPRQKKHIFDQSKEHQIEEFATSCNRSVEEVEEWLKSKAA